MKATFSLFCLMIIVVGFALVGDAIAQPDNPSPAATETSGSGSAADEAKPPEEPKPSANEAKPTKAEGEPSDAKAEEEKGEAAKAIEQGHGLFSSVKGGHWLLAFGFLGMLIGSALRLGLVQKWDFWGTKAGGFTMAGLVGVASLGAEIVTAGGFTVEGLAAALTVLAGAMASHGPAKAIKDKVRPA